MENESYRITRVERKYEQKKKRGARKKVAVSVQKAFPNGYPFTWSGFSSFCACASGGVDASFSTWLSSGVEERQGKESEERRGG